MSDILKVLNDNSGALSAIFSGVVTVATVVYAWLTAKLVQETRQMRQAQTEPRIQVTHRVRDDWINLMDIEVRNIGLGPAYDIKFNVQAETASSGTKQLSDDLMKLASFNKGLSYLGPSHSYASFWTSLVEGDSTKIDSRFVIGCTYRSVTGVQYSHNCIVDLSELKGSTRVGEPPLHKIAKHIEKLEKNLRQLAGNHLKVDVYTCADREVERKRIEEQINEARGKG